jgi:phage gp29-like protein
MLLDLNGNPIDMRALREPQTAHVGSLRAEFEAHPARGLTPARLASIMQGAERGHLLDQLDLADDMEERDAHLFAELSKRRGAVTGLEFSWEEPEGATAIEKSWAAQIKDLVGQVTAEASGVTGGIKLVIQTMTDAILKGFSAQEMVWHKRGNALVPHITAQPQRWFTTSADRRSFLLRSNATVRAPGMPVVSGEVLRPLAWLMHAHPARSGYVSRMSLSRTLFWPYLFKNFAVRDLAEFLEIYGIPMRIGKYPSGATEAEKASLMRAVTQLGHNAAGIMPQGMTLEFEEAAKGGGEPYMLMMKYCDGAQSKAILGQTLTADAGDKGSHALGSVHNEVRMDIRNDDSDKIEESVFRQLVQPMGLLNIPGCDVTRLPRPKFDTSEPEDLTAYADALHKLAKAGFAIPLKWASDKLGIPDRVGQEPIVLATSDGAAAPANDEAAQPAAGRPGAANDETANDRAAAAAALAAAAATTTPAQDPIDEVNAEMLEDWRLVMAPLVEPLLAELDNAVAQGETLEQFRERLGVMATQMGHHPLAERLARGTFVAALMGASDVDLSANEPG